MERSDLIKELLKTLGAMGYRDRDVLIRRAIGVETLDQIGASYNLTPQRIHQIETECIADLVDILKSNTL